MARIFRALRWAAGLAAAMFATPASADVAKLEAALALFNEAALWRDGGLPGGGTLFATGGVFRFNTGLRVHVGGATTSTVREVAERHTREAAAIAGLALEFVDSADKANLKFNFFQEYMAPPGIPSAGCVTQTRATPTNPRDATIHVRMTFSSCTAHELMHALGFPGHPHDLDTVLSYTRRGGDRSFTELDKLVLRTLYRANIASGTYHLPALVAARAYLAGELGIVAAGASADHLARPFMDAQVERLRSLAEPYIQMQLGNAYSFGHYVAIDQAEAVRFWQLAAAKNNPEATFRIGLALRTGQGIAADAAAARTRLRAASELGHNQAPRALGDMLRGGEGGAADAVEAFAFLDLAHRRGVAAATGARDRLADGFDAATKARATARAAELPTTPPRPAQ
ncbi:MAG: sel1 repeat family protein [Telmatospirillum sp.]|nr:sel1 repeat family protein [Telmatospirillum sp.]